MNRLFMAVVLMCACAGANATAIKTYEARLEVAADGSALVTVNLKLTGSQPGMVPLPVGFGTLDDFQLQDAPRGVQLNPVPSKDQSIVEIDLPQAVAADVKLSFTFRAPDVLAQPKNTAGEKSGLPAGSRLLRHGFVNTQAATIAAYRVEVRLPEEVRVQMIREQLPKPKRTEVLPRVRLDRIDGNQGALLQVANLKQGDKTSMVLEVVEDGRSYVWLLVGLLLSAAYLVGFRDLVTPAAR
jgi:hypothetical protein